MAKILSTLNVAPLFDGVHWRLMGDFFVQDDEVGEIKLYAGFPTDFGSIWQPLTGIIPNTGHGSWGYAVHDWLYASQICPRDTADRCLRRLLILRGMPIVEVDVVYECIRIGGWHAWDAHTENGDPQHIRDGRFDLLVGITTQLLASF